MENNQENKVMETGNTKDVEVDLEQVGDKVVGGNAINHNKDEMMRLRNFGRKSLEEVRQKLGSLGLTLNNDIE